MTDIKIKEIPEHIAYTAEFDIDDYYDFFDFETDSNSLVNLEELMHRENPGVNVPEIPDDYNYFTHPQGVVPKGRMHIHYYDMVDRAGMDNADGKYRFVVVPKIRAACMMHRGSFRDIDKTLRSAFLGIRKAGFTVCGDSRISAIHGPWDRESWSDHLVEIQIPIE